MRLAKPYHSDLRPALQNSVAVARPGAADDLTVSFSSTALCPTYCFSQAEQLLHTRCCRDLFACHACSALCAATRFELLQLINLRARQLRYARCRSDLLACHACAALCAATCCEPLRLVNLQAEQLRYSRCRGDLIACRACAALCAATSFKPLRS